MSRNVIGLLRKFLEYISCNYCENNEQRAYRLENERINELALNRQEETLDNLKELNDLKKHMEEINKENKEALEEAFEGVGERNTNKNPNQIGVDDSKDNSVSNNDKSLDSVKLERAFVVINRNKDEILNIAINEEKVHVAEKYYNDFYGNVTKKNATLGNDGRVKEVIYENNSVNSNYCDWF